MTKKLFALIFIAGLFSCENSTDQKDSQLEPTNVTTEHHIEEVGLSLDNGKLWEANPETTAGVDNMIDLMNSFTDKDNVESYGQLTKSLKSEFSLIFKYCTMKGESHNQLHSFLVPIKDLFKGLSSSDLDTCKESFDKLNAHLAIYKNYFE